MPHPHSRAAYAPEGAIGRTCTRLDEPAVNWSEVGRKWTKSAKCGRNWPNLPVPAPPTLVGRDGSLRESSTRVTIPGGAYERCRKHLVLDLPCDQLRASVSESLGFARSHNIPSDPRTAICRQTLVGVRFHARTFHSPDCPSFCHNACRLSRRRRGCGNQ